MVFGWHGHAQRLLQTDVRTMLGWHGQAQCVSLTGSNRGLLVRVKRHCRCHSVEAQTRPNAVIRLLWRSASVQNAW